MTSDLKTLNEKKVKLSFACGQMSFVGLSSKLPFRWLEGFV